MEGRVSRIKQCSGERCDQMLDKKRSTIASTTLLLSSLILFASPANAAGQSACATRATELKRSIDPSAHTRKVPGGLVDVATQVRFVCQRDVPHPVILFTYPSEYPPEEFYDLLASITARVAHQAADKMRLRAHRCHRAAKRASYGRAQKAFDGYRLDCDRHFSRSSFSFVTLPNRAVTKESPAPSAAPG
jgi:hypothetical protein